MIAHDTTSLTRELRDRGINPTQQRLAIAQLLFSRCEHLSAEQVFENVNDGAGNEQRISKATVYNTLGLFARKGLVREVIADPSRVFYDPNTAPHHHIYNVTSGMLTDIDADTISLGSLPEVPEGTRLEGVDVVVRVSDHKA